MGFFSALVGVARTVLGVAAPIAAPVARAAAPVAAPVMRALAAPSVRAVGLAAVGGALGTGAVMALAPGAQAAPSLVALAGDRAMKNRISTVVQTIAPDGTIIESKVLEGAPFLMKKDFVTAKRVRKLISKAKTKIVPTPRQESEQSKLMKAVVTTATRRVLTGPDPCPPKC